MSWVLFYYSGAAAAAGQSYSGAILASATGDWPPEKEAYIDRIYAGLDRAGIKPWELFMVRCVREALRLRLVWVLVAAQPLTHSPKSITIQARPQLGRAPSHRPLGGGPLPVSQLHGGF